MRKVLKRNGCKSASHQFFKDRAKNRVDDLQMMFSDLQSARKESRTVEATVLEEQVYQMLREWKAELNEPSPASSLQGYFAQYKRNVEVTMVVEGGREEKNAIILTHFPPKNDSLGTFSTDIYRLLHLCDEEDDASSPFELSAPKPEPDIQNFQSGRTIAIQEGFDVKHGPEEQNRSGIDQCKESPGFQSLVTTNMDMATTQLDYNQFNLHLDLEHHYLNGYLGVGVDTTHPISGFLPIICPPPSAFLGPKCALWDCPRPAQGADWWLDYCSSFHATLALNEGPPGMTPVLRPGGIGLKDGLLFAALSAKVQGKDVGIPECEGAATTKSPWNAPELFDLSVLEGETIREWLFFDKPRRAFESGNRKQRSLPDYSGRGWHESRKQVMNEFNGLKRSYYMDPQPLNIYEWHLYEYEINKCDACALYRLELKLVDGKKTPRGKTSQDSLSELQKKMGRLTAEFPLDNKRPLKGSAKINGIDGIRNLSAPNRSVGPDETFEFGAISPYGYLVENISGYYLK